MDDVKKYDPEDLKKLQKILLSMLKDILKICDEHDIDVFGVSGTGIGAARHNGFIPWDDDIDLGFLRKDFDRFVEACKTDLPDKYELITMENTEDYFAHFSKIVLKGTRFDEWWADQVSFTQGIFVDLFVLENLTDSKIKRIYYTKFGRVIRKLIPISILKPTNLNQPARSVVLVLHYILKILHITPAFLKKRFLKMVTRYNDRETKYVYDITGFKFTYIYDRHLLDNIIKVPFEDTEIGLPENYIEYLSVEYENPMVMPPVEKRFNHVEADIDFGPYK